MAIYSITDLEKLTGIKAHTIRIWEKRFNIIHPKRTTTNIRYYDDNDLKKVTSIALLNHKGYKISSISMMPDNEIEDIVAHLSDVASFNVDSIDALTLSIIHLDQTKFIHIIDRHIKQYGFDQTFEELLMPLLDKLHDMWLGGSIRKAHEEFAMQLIKRKIIQQIILFEDKPKLNENRFILAMPGTENQQLSRFFIEYLLSQRSIPSLYMSNDSDVKDIVEAAQTYKAKFILCFVNEEPTLNYAKDLLHFIQKVPENITPVFVGFLAPEISRCNAQIRAIYNFEDLKNFLNFLSGFNG